MTDAHVTRLYVFAVTLLVFFVAWALIAARPWAPSRATADPRLAALVAREQRIQIESRLVQRIRAQRARQATVVASAPTPAPRIVKLPPLVITRTS